MLSQNAWTRLTPTPQENSLNGFTSIPGTGNLVAVGEGSTIMISENAGESWQIILNPAGMDNEYQCYGVSFINETTGFINGGYETILKTTDGGYNWEVKYDGNAFYYWKSFNDLEFTNETTGFAVGDEGQLLKTTDVGETWSLQPLDVGFNLDLIEFADSLTGFILGGNDSLMLKTLDGGETWNAIDLPAGLKGTYPSEIYFVNDSVGFIFTTENSMNSYGLIFKTTDAGLSWAQVYSDPSAYTAKFTFFDDQHGIAGCISWDYRTKILTTSDGGTTWTGDWPPDFPWWSTNAVYATDENTAFSVGALGRIFKTQDKGNTWEAMSSKGFGDIYDAQFLNQDKGYTLSSGYGGGISFSVIKKTVDGGTSWQQVGSGGFERAALHFLDSDAGFVVYWFWGLNLMKTLNGGNSWTETNTNFDFDPDVIRFSDISHGLISGGGQVIRTTDSGLTWTEVSTGISSWSVNFYDIEYRSADTVFMAGEAGSETILLKSVDGGYSWEIIPIEDHGSAADLFFTSDDTAFLACFNTILKSTDGGSTWTPTTLNNQNPISFSSLYFPSASVGFAVGDGPFENMMKTTDGGDTWNVIDTQVSSGLSNVYFSNEDNGLILGQEGVILKTTSGGITATNKNTETSLMLFDVFPNPFTDQIVISIDPAVSLTGTLLTISDVWGKTLGEFPVNNSHLSFNADNLLSKPGIYLLKMRTDNGNIQVKKVIKL